jgi:hypothetical protein
MRTATRFISSDSLRCEALFVSPLQPSDRADLAQVEAAILAAVRRFGDGGVAERVAQEFGDHPETAVARMRWARAAAGTPARAAAGTPARAAAGTRRRRVRRGLSPPARSRAATAPGSTGTTPWPRAGTAPRSSPASPGGSAGTTAAG